MFKIDERPTFTVPVKARTPDGVDAPFTATFRALPTSETDKFALATGSGTTDFLKAVVASLGDLADKNGPVAYSETVRDAVLDLPWARIPLANAYFEGVGGAREGN